MDGCVGGADVPLALSIDGASSPPCPTTGGRPLELSGLSERESILQKPILEPRAPSRLAMSLSLLLSSSAPLTHSSSPCRPYSPGSTSSRRAGKTSIHPVSHRNMSGQMQGLRSTPSAIKAQLGPRPPGDGLFPKLEGLAVCSGRESEVSTWCRAHISGGWPGNGEGGELTIRCTAVDGTHDATMGRGRCTAPQTMNWFR